MSTEGGPKYERDINKARTGAEAEQPLRDIARKTDVKIEPDEKLAFDNVAERYGEKAMQEYEAAKDLLQAVEMSENIPEQMLKKCVADGAQLLDEKAPGWYKSPDFRDGESVPQQPDAPSTEGVLRAQLMISGISSTNYTDNLKALGLDAKAAFRYGFRLGSGNVDSRTRRRQASVIDDAWTWEIRHRRNEGGS